MPHQETSQGLKYSAVPADSFKKLSTYVAVNELTTVAAGILIEPEASRTMLSDVLIIEVPSD